MKDGRIGVLIVDDHAVVRTGLSALLETESDITVVGTASNGEEAIAEAKRLVPDVVVMDLMMPKMDGVEATARIKAEVPAAKVLLLTTFGSSDGIAHALENGATGAVLKNSEDRELIAAVRKVASGESCVSDEVRRQLAANPPVPDLTPRQLEILDCMTKGLTNKDIARQLGIRPDGVNLHVIAILQKVGAANRTEAVAIAFRRHLLKI